MGLGETWDEIKDTMEDLRSVECDLLTIGQYLRPSQNTRKWRNGTRRTNSTL